MRAYRIEMTKMDRGNAYTKFRLLWGKKRRLTVLEKRGGRDNIIYVSFPFNITLYFSSPPKLSRKTEPQTPVKPKLIKREDDEDERLIAVRGEPYEEISTRVLWNS
ncbi:hypothetical protein YC2023_046464 [Brassica napus]